MNSLVSILIPCYNAEQWISQAIESALAQTWSDKEIIVVDDGSKDRSLDIIRRFDGRIRWETGINRGGGVSRNRLLQLARGNWVQYLDADDYLLPKKIAEQMEVVDKYQNLDVVFGPVTIEHWSVDGAWRELLPIPTPHDLWTLLASWKLPQTGAPLWRKQAVLDVGGWKHDQPCCQEHELYLRMLIGEKRFAYSPTNGAIYRQWSTQTVCTQNISEVHRRRLEIERRLEDHLRTRRELTSERLRAINQARFQIARVAWQYDCAFSIMIMDQVRKSDPYFSPRGEAAPLHYRLVFHTLGFKAAEKLATNYRKMRR